MILRNVISTRSPMATCSGSASVSSQEKRPPPSKSTTAAITGGLGEKASRSMVNVATVPESVGHRDLDHPVDRLAVDTNPHGREMEGAALGASVADEPVLVAGRAERRRGRRSGRIGSAGRLSGQEARARTGRWRRPDSLPPAATCSATVWRRLVGGDGVGRLQDERGGPVGQDHQPRSSGQAGPDRARWRGAGPAGLCPGFQSWCSSHRPLGPRPTRRQTLAPPVRGFRPPPGCRCRRGSDPPP